jgi:hypothetical protein
MGGELQVLCVKRCGIRHAPSGAIAPRLPASIRASVERGSYAANLTSIAIAHLDRWLEQRQERGDLSASVAQLSDSVRCRHRNNHIIENTTSLTAADVPEWAILSEPDPSELRYKNLARFAARETIRAIVQ